MMNFDIPASTQAYLDRLDAFIEAEIMPLQMQDDNNRFFDHRREDARTNWDDGGRPTEDWEGEAHCRQGWVLSFRTARKMGRTERQ